MNRVRDLLLSPVNDYLGALGACFDRSSAGRIAVLAVSLALCWWLYVPAHELLHVLGCVATGGSVSRLEIAPLYGGDFFARVFPFVVSGSEYAGRLSGFDTHGSDLTYLATDFLPYAITVLVGIPLLRSAAREGDRPLVGCAKLGASLPLAFVPFVSVTGDYYEMGSVLVSRLATWCWPSLDPARWRSDDLFKLIGELSAAGMSRVDAAVLSISLLVGIVLIFATYWLGDRWSALVLSSK